MRRRVVRASILFCSNRSRSKESNPFCIWGAQSPSSPNYSSLPVPGRTPRGICTSPFDLPSLFQDPAWRKVLRVLCVCAGSHRSWCAFLITLISGATAEGGTSTTAKIDCAETGPKIETCRYLAICNSHAWRRQKQIASIPATSNLQFAKQIE